ncbi:MAG: hypothetical protein IJI60_03845 [Bacilli bacterium]|nr:hypothetical protein [Bacilli bacterium]
MEEEKLTTQDQENINVELGSLEETYNKFRRILDAMEAAFERANNAGEESIEAVGGEGTRVGSAIVNAVVNINKDTFNTAKQNLINYLDGLRISHDALSREENALVEVIHNSAENYSANKGNTNQEQ